ncbi:DUF4214 domain-containing protein [Roseicella sp. DB1501]|uniref:DUF4214 domain-containing protein n=1 Tax=Roseicella sp. DB1501 TaxID=2730925 RepID=UPI0014921962|nr:DUF4214 domain-containing protein [Roseicella sp. DB1501]NOG68885.1 DUF4214 domain-containing protein [Roseicella sp. DB1501]
MGNDSVDSATDSRHFAATELLGGEDHDFVVNLYLALLGRWPDAVGYRHYRDAIAGQPERRLAMLREMASSAEAGRYGTRIGFEDAPPLPPGPHRVLALSLSLRTEWLQREVARLQEATGLLTGAGPAGALIEARDAALHFEINALRREVTERLDGLLGPAPGEAAAGRDAAVEALARLVADHAGTLVAAAEAKFEARLRSLEARLLALEARPAA